MPPSPLQPHPPSDAHPTPHAGHGHGHGHHHGHLPADASFDRAFGIGIALNLGFVAVEAFFGWRVDSLALLADAGHNLSDVAGLALGWGGALASRVRPGDRYTYGWKRASILAAFTNAVLLLVAMGSLAWEAVRRFGHAAPTSGGTVMLIAAAGILVNGATALLFMRGSADDMNVRGAYLHMAGDALVSAGVVVTGGLTLWLGWGWIDPAASLAITVVIVASTWGLLRQSARLMFDGVPEHIDLPAVKRVLEQMPGVERVHDLHVWAMGTTQVALTAHLVMPAGCPDDAFLEAANHHLRDGFRIGHVTLQVTKQPFAMPCGQQPGGGPQPRRDGVAGEDDAHRHAAHDGPRPAHGPRHGHAH